MIIEKVEMTNFRSYRDTVVEFDKGVNVIVGENGAGKTSILEAIYFALFRETPRRVRIGDLISRGAEGDMRVALTFQSNGKRFKVVRTRGRENSDKLFQDGTMITGDEKELQTTREIESSIHMDSKLFTNAVYIRQGEIDALLSFDSAVRKKLMGKLIGIEDLENAWVVMPELIKKFEKKIEEDIEAKIKDIMGKIGDSESRMRFLNAESFKIKRLLREENEKLVDAKKRWEKCGLLEEAVSKTLDLSGNAKELKKELKKIKEYRIGIEESKNGYERYVELTEELEKLKDVESDGKVKLEGLQARWEKKIRELRDVIAAKKSEESRIRKAVNELEEADDRCPICGQELDEEHKRRVFEEYECEMRVLKEELARLEKDLESVEEDAAIEYTKAMDELKARSRALESEREKYADAYMGYIAADSYLKKFATDEEKLSEDLKAIERKLSAMWESIEDDAKRAGLYDMLKPIPPEEWGRAARDVRKKLQLRLDMINGEIKRLEREQGRLEGELKAVKDALEEYKIEVTRLNAKVAENEKLKRFTAFLTEIRGLFGKDHLQRELRLRHKPRIERYTKEHFEKFNLAYTDVTLTDDYSIVVYDSQGERSADMLSGGERISAALALRFGIANDLLESASAMELMILDEPTIHLDEHRRQELVDIVKRLSSIPQTIVVTHDREFEAAADRLISVVKEEGTSRVEYAGE